MPPPGTLGSNAEAEFRRFCTGNSRLRVPTYRTSILVSRNNSCWTPSDHVIDRKSTRLNSSHQIISYAVFCLKKKNSINRDYSDQMGATAHSTRLENVAIS